jgi:hypothetical protein
MPVDFENGTMIRRLMDIAERWQVCESTQEGVARERERERGKKGGYNSTLKLTAHEKQAHAARLRAQESQAQS